MDLATSQDVLNSIPQNSSTIFESTKSYKDNSTIMIIPTRGMIDFRVVNSLMMIIKPPNQQFLHLWGAGMEVGDAYNSMVKTIVEHPQLKDFKYLFTVEDDMVLPPDTLIKLLANIGDYDSLSALYYVKGDQLPLPQCWGDPKISDDNFIPQMPLEHGILEVNGIGMGACLWKLEQFKNVPEPWFKTLASVEEGCGTQDLYYCKKARKAGKKFGVLCDLRVGHLDINAGVLY